MKCKFCDSPEELVWPSNYVKGNKPINVETNKVHKCDAIIRYNCSCGNIIHQEAAKFTKREPCSVCNDVRFRN